MKTAQYFRLKAAAVAVALCFAPPGWANPVGGTVVSGSASISSNGAVLTVTNTPGTVLNWQQFNIAAGETTRFVQQSAQSTVLNRVVTNNPSQIFGTLSSNGQVYLINPSGILFGVGSVVDVNGLIASTLNISNADFLLGRHNFSGNNGTSVLNQGTITTPLGGRVYLIGNNVTNQGVITSPQGQVLLAAGNQVSLVDSNTPHISVTLAAPNGGQALNLGTVSAQGGSIDVYGALVQQQGVLRADSAAQDPQGNIVLSATQNVTLAQGSVTTADGGQGGSIKVQAAGTTQVAGLVSAQGRNGKGGTVDLLGQQVNVDSTAQVDASGALGGGALRVGGDFQGKNPGVQNALSSNVAAGASLRADAVTRGNGGTVVVWADDSTHFVGHISARGGAQGGNGGQVEVSGKRALAFRGTVDTLAPAGKAGSLLLDPGTICISNVTTAMPTCVSLMTPTTIATNVQTTGTFTVQTTGGDVVVIDPITISPTTVNTGKNLFLQATGGNVLLLNATAAAAYPGGTGGSITSNGANVILTATGTTTGTGEVRVSNTVSTGGGFFTINAQGKASIEGTTIVTSGGSLNITALDFWLGGNTSVQGATIDTSGGLAGPPVGNMGGFSITGTGPGVGAGVTIGLTSMIKAGNSRISLAGMNFNNLNTANVGTANYSILSNAEARFSFDQIAGGFLDANVRATLIQTYSAAPGGVARDIYLGLTPGTANPVCQNALCLPVNPNNHLSAPYGLAVASQGNLFVASNTLLEGANGQYALLALGDIVLNGSLTVVAPAAPVLDPVTRLPIPLPQANLALIAGGNVLNNVGAAALTMPVGHDWWLFAKDPLTTVLNGLTPTSTNLGQNPATFAGVVNNNWLLPLNAGTFSSTAGSPLAQMTNALFGGMGLAWPTAVGNRAWFWGGANNALTQSCTLNPVLCPAATNAAVQSNTQTGNTTTSTVNNGQAVRGSLTYSASLGVGDQGLVWVVYDDVRRAHQEARLAEDELEHAQQQANAARDAAARAAAQRNLLTKQSAVDGHRAEGRVRESEMELRAAEAELQQAHSPLALQQAETRMTVANFRRADADVQKLNAELRRTRAEGHLAQQPEEKQAVETQLTELQLRLSQAELKRAEADLAQAGMASKRAEGSPQAALKLAEMAVKQARLEARQAEVEKQRAKEPTARQAAEEKMLQAEAKRAEAEARHASLEAERHEAGADHAGQRQLLADIRQTQADLKRAELEALTAKDPQAREAAEQKLAQLALRKAEAELKLAQAEGAEHPDAAHQAVLAAREAARTEKQAELAVQTAQEGAPRDAARLQLAEARIKTAQAEQRQAEQEAAVIRAAAAQARSQETRQVLQHKAEAAEARVNAKAADAAWRTADLAAKRAESDVKRAETVLQNARTPAERAAAGKALTEKQANRDKQQAAASEQRGKLEAAIELAETKEDDYRDALARRDERALESFAGMDLSERGRRRSQDLMDMRQEFMREKLSGAAKRLAANPQASELPTCEAGATGDCVPAAAAANTNAQQQLAGSNLPVPTTVFLPGIQRKVAVVIGINAYQDPEIPALNGAVRDADAVGGLLHDKLGYDVRMLRNASRADIVRMLRQVAAETGAHDSVVVYYAGHGYELEDTREGHWLPSDASTSSPENWISNGDISKLLGHIPAKQMLVVSDSCFSGSLVREMKVNSQQTSVESPDTILQKRSVLVMSSGGDEPVMDEGRDGHSLFSWHLLDKVGKLGSFEHGAEVFDAIKAGVVADGVKQLPNYGASLSAGHTDGGEYLFEVRQYGAAN